MAEKGPAELARVTAPFFADLPQDVFHASIARYCRDGIWSRETVVSESGFDRLAYSLQAGGFIKTRDSYASCVHNFDVAHPLRRTS